MAGPYPEVVDKPMHAPPIPVEALARRERLRVALLAVGEAGPSREPAPLLALRAALAGVAALDPASWLEAVSAAGLLEEAGEILRTTKPAEPHGSLAEMLAPRLLPLALKAQQRRAARWQLDTRRTLIRVGYAKGKGALGFDEGDLHAIFLHAFRFEGFALALDLGKRPRPLLTLGLPLPVGVGGLAESMDAVLKVEPGEEPALLMARLNRRLPEGLHIHHWEPLPGYAAPVIDLALLSRWRWDVVADQRAGVAAGVARFLAAGAWPWERGGSRVDTPLDLRSILLELRWEAAGLCFATRMGVHHALNPTKMLGAILDLAPGDITGLTRTAVDLKPDARLAQGERFEAKLKNMYEDAVLLAGGSNITLVDEDDDEPIRLGPSAETP